jgi:hypothetical protein
MERQVDGLGLIDPKSICEALGRVFINPWQA